MNKHILAGLMAIGVLLSPLSCAQASSKNDILGVEEAQWQTDLKIVGGDYAFADTFLPEVKESQHKLESKFGSEHFEKLNSKQDNLRAQRRKDPLLHIKHPKARSSFVLDLELGKKEYHTLLNYIPTLGEYYAEEHIAQILPYLAYCINYDVKPSILDYYIKEFVRRETPVDIVCERLYRIANDKM